ncbi:MAG: mRNA surveillance protein pelota, partial [Thermoplasmata archaeon]|nr:mRNA surveillance protein pelota [Thermoplasmata archaeon]
YKTGQIKLRVQTLDDLWHLYNIIEPGDLVFALTTRREEARADAVRAERGEKKKMRLGIRVEKVEFHEFADWLRVHGTIENGPQDIGSYHTLNITVDENMTIQKVWTLHQMDVLDRAEKTMERPLVIFIAIDDEEATIAQLREYGVKFVASVVSGKSGKFYSTKAKKPEEYFEEIIGIFKASAPGPLIILGPGFAKEGISKYGRDKYPKLFDDAQVVSSGQTGMAGVNEILKMGIGSKILEDSRVGLETRLVEQLLAEIGKNGLFAYGKADVQNAINANAVETLLVTSNSARERIFEQIMEEASKLGANLVVVSEHHDAGKQLDALGSIGAILRYKLT